MDILFFNIKHIFSIPKLFSQLKNHYYIYNNSRKISKDTIKVIS